MSPKDTENLHLEFHPLTKHYWKEFERFFGTRGACGGCWCMWWRLPRSEFMQNRGERNKNAFKKIVDSSKAPGILAFLGSEPVGWCSVAPREEYPALERSRLLKRFDAEPVWSVVCFFVSRKHRHKGISLELLRAAIKHAKKKGGKIIEGYPIDPSKGGTPDPFAYTGLVSAFRKAGFTEICRRSPKRPIMRCKIQKDN